MEEGIFVYNVQLIGVLGSFGDCALYVYILAGGSNMNVDWSLKSVVWATILGEKMVNQAGAD